MNHPHRLAHAAGLGELHIDAIGVRGGRRDVTEVLAALVHDHRKTGVQILQGIEGVEVGRRDVRFWPAVGIIRSSSIRDDVRSPGTA